MYKQFSFNIFSGFVQMDGDTLDIQRLTTNKMSQHRFTHPRALTARLLDFLKSSSVGLCAACTVLTTEKVWSELTDGCRAAARHTGGGREEVGAR